MAMLGVLVLVTVLLAPRPSAATVVSARFPEGATHGFLALRTVDAVPLASGEFLQVGHGSEVKSRMVFHFKDGSVFEETVVFTQQRVFALQSYHLLQRRPAFPEDTEIALARASGK